MEKNVSRNPSAPPIQESSRQDNSIKEALYTQAIQASCTPGKNLKQVLNALIDAVLPVWSFPEPLRLNIVFREIPVASPGWTGLERVIREELVVKNQTAGYIEAGYAETGTAPDYQDLLEKERALLKNLARLVECLIEKKSTELALKKRKLLLKEKNAELEKKNLAIKEILSQIEAEKKTIQDDVQTNIKSVILPVISKLKSDTIPGETRKQYLEMLETNLGEITSCFTNKLAKEEIKLSPREIEICNMITNGFHTKEIAQILQISILTVERHRFNIRKKIGIRKHQVNLQSFLQKF